MSDSFQTAAKAAQAETTVKKSKFICHVSQAWSSDEAQAFVEGIRKSHRDANHNVWAWRVGMPTTIERFSDDGEPAGTAGIPVLEVLRKRQLVNCVVVVTRYFGGTLLGAGGLVRAYTDSAAQGLADAGVVTYSCYRLFTVPMPYTLLGPVINMLAELGVKVETPDYGAEVILKGWIEPIKAAVLHKRLAELGQGQLVIEWSEERYLAD